MLIFTLQITPEKNNPPPNFLSMIPTPTPTPANLLANVWFLSFFWGGGSLFGPRPIRIRILMPSPYSYLPELATTGLIAGAHTGVHLSSLRHCLRGRPTCSPRRENPLFLCYSCRWYSATFILPLMPIFVFSDIRGGHSAPVIWAGFHLWVFLPSTFCHSVCEMAPLYPLWCWFCILGHQRRPLCARYLGGVSLAGFPSLHFLPLGMWDDVTRLPEERQQQVWRVFLLSAP